MVFYVSKLDKLKTKRQIKNYLKKVEEWFEYFNQDWMEINNVLKHRKNV